jgi:hypothetical protein
LCALVNDNYDDVVAHPGKSSTAYFRLGLMPRSVGQDQEKVKGGRVFALKEQMPTLYDFVGYDGANRTSTDLSYFRQHAKGRVRVFHWAQNHVFGETPRIQKMMIGLYKFS